MKRIINGKRYDTETARLVGEYCSPGSDSDFSHLEESLYQKRTGEYFIAGVGGPMTKYSVSTGQNSWSGGAKIITLTSEEAREWAEEHLTADEYEAEFPVTPDEPELSIGGNIRAAREAHNLTQVQLAERMGVDQARISQWESGQTEPLASSIMALARALGVEPGELLK
jgi:DNA-binding transcriptional regulator YiaG